MKENGVLTTKIMIGILVGIFLIGSIYDEFDYYLKGSMHLARSDVEFQSVDKNHQYITEDGNKYILNDGHFTFLGIGVLRGEIWRLITGGFLHNDIVHLLCNCYCLWQFLPWITTQFGRFKAQLTLWLAVIGGAVLSGFKYDENGLGISNINGLGISGGIFGLFGVYILSLWTIKKYNDNPQIRNALNSAYLMLGINLFLGFSIPNISNLGHIGGLITGLILGKIFMRPKYEAIS